MAETLSLAKQAESQRDLEMKKAQFLEVTKRQQAQADKAYDIQTNIMQQQVIAEQVKVQQVEKEQQVKVQEAEINRREKELIATVLKGAEIERQRIETLAAAEKQRLIAEAEGQASSIRAQGEAEAEIIFKKGDAEARAMNVKAEAYPGIQPGGGDRQAVRQHARDREGIGRSAGQRRQDHHRLHRKRRWRGHEQGHRRHHQDGGASAGAVRDALGHAAVGVAGQGAPDRRQSPEAGRSAESVASGGGRVGARSRFVLSVFAEPKFESRRKPERRKPSRQ